ncbi:MAG: hydrogenase maturation nickel metallochaperone HypA [Candidatus Bathyarchaeia archaeon]
MESVHPIIIGGDWELHEFSTMQSIVEVALKAAKDSGAERILFIELGVGEMTLLNTEQLRFAFSVLSRGTIAEGASLGIEVIPCIIRCKGCGYSGRTGPPMGEDHFIPIIPRCPKCGSSELSIESGRECSIKRIRVRVPKDQKATEGGFSEDQNR